MHVGAEHSRAVQKATEAVVRAPPQSAGTQQGNITIYNRFYMLDGENPRLRNCKCLVHVL